MVQSAGDFMGLTGRTAIVWGGGSGMGRATAERYANLGCDVAVVDMNGGLAAETADHLRGLGVKSHSITANVQNEEQVVEAVKAARAALGCPTVSTNVVGMAAAHKIIDMTGAEWEAELALNLKPAFLIGREVARAMVAEQRQGAMSFVGSVAAIISFPHGLSGYSSSKAGVHSLVRSMAIEWAPHGIRANCVAPGSINTNRIPATPASIAKMKQKVPSGRAGEVGEIADALVYLCSERASYVNGATLLVDGGYIVVPAVGAD